MSDQNSNGICDELENLDYKIRIFVAPISLLMGGIMSFFLAYYPPENSKPLETSANICYAIGLASYGTARKPDKQLVK